MNTEEQSFSASLRCLLSNVISSLASIVLSAQSSASLAARASRALLPVRAEFKHPATCTKSGQPGLKYYLLPIMLTLTGTAFISACSPDVTTPTATNSGNNTGEQNNSSTTNTGAANNGLFSLQLGSNSVGLVEGNNLNVDISVIRSEGHTLPVTLAAAGQTDADKENLYWGFADERIESSENGTSINIGLNIGTLPLLPHTRTLRIVGTDGSSQAIETRLDLQITPTSRPDVYLLVGQSNMVGFSESNAKQDWPGGIDETNDRIQQLNVTGNDSTNFNTFAAFTDLSRVAVPSPRLTLATDPLHSGYDSQLGGKEGTRVGLGLSFAKESLALTTASVFLVPAAWADTGFCRRPRALYEGSLGWNARPSNNPALSGTLLHDRAIARANLALDETGGILRGILWHQGEADSETRACAESYEQNIIALIASLRTNINPDERGPGARGPNANIPFVLGTMSKGGAYADQSASKRIVDGVHRNIGEIVNNAEVVSADDLLPPAYPCGEGDCIHFGASAYRELGRRYSEYLRRAALR